MEATTSVEADFAVVEAVPAVGDLIDPTITTMKATMDMEEEDLVAAAEVGAADAAAVAVAEVLKETADLMTATAPTMPHPREI